MTDGTVADRIAARFEAVRAAADGTARPDWLATAATDATVRDRLGALADALVDAADASPGPAYGATLSDAARADAGQFATHPGIAQALCRWAIRPREDGRVPRVLDPATGAGVFALAACDRLAMLAADADPDTILDRVVGIDADPIPLALTAHRLLDWADGADGGGPAVPRLYETDFFDVTPAAPDADAIALTDEGLAAGRFDAVVGNPPYVRQETVDTDRARAHLAAFGPDGETPYRDGERALSRRSDAYVYFLTHATQFLRPGGRLAVVVPAKWLTTRYGGPFQRFLFDHYRLHGVVGFGARAFADALVDTVLLLAERCPDRDRRRATPVRFCRLDEQVTATELSSLVTETPTPAGAGLAVDRFDAGRTVTVGQGRLADDERAKIAPYLDAAVPILRLLSADALAPLGDLARVKRGVMTGANDFFFLDADGPGAGIDDRFRTPAIKSIRDVSGRTITTADTDRSLLTVHDYVREIAAETGAEGAALEAAVTDALARDGYDGLRTYLDWGREQGFHERSSCRARPVWFDLGACPAPALFVPKFFDQRVLALANPDGLLASNAVDCLWVDDSDPGVLLGVLNATVTKACIEAWGRSEGGGALQVMTYELRSLPVPDPRRFDSETRRAIADAADALLAGADDTQRRLDGLVLDAVDADLSVDACRRLRDRMVERRRATGARAVAPIVTE
jgi:hypothetical protein